MVHELGKENSIFNEFLRQVRDVHIQKDRMRMRRNMERLGEIFAYEISKTMDYEPEEVKTPLGTADMNLMTQMPVLATIMRAGLPFHQGFLNYYDSADSAFVSAYRQHVKNEDEFEVKVEYLSSPSLEDQILVMADPMLATGSSMVLAHNALLEKGNPKHVHVAALLASKEGISHVKKNLAGNLTLWVGAIDDELTAQSYIVPGLGDAGDLCYGTK
ncbi:MAG: uracil phosphoribosyltransferase [Flavobacteriales bacterium]|nr:uracil phosphoribosyltransferase [Flavobacteriales bacterium]